jgi:hypothetical protein
MQKARYAAALGIPLIALLSFTLVTAWTGPSASPPNGNVAAPVNVGTTDQVKNGGLGVNSLAVFGNSLLGGSTGSNAYLNFGPTSGTNGYGIRDNAGLLEFKNFGGSWSSIQATVFNLVGGTGSWATSGTNDIHNTNTGNVGIKTSSPTAPLTVRQVNDTQGGGNAGLRVENTSGAGITQILTGGDNASYIFNGVGSNYLMISSNGNVGIGMAGPGYKLHVAGDIYANGGWLRTSGSAGWYSESYGGGWYMQDST